MATRRLAGLSNVRRARSQSKVPEGQRRALRVNKSPVGHQDGTVTRRHASSRHNTRHTQHTKPNLAEAKGETASKDRWRLRYALVGTNRKV